ncbi:hypothetical protein PR003_g26894 [Phytophthora rubi]|uniref:SWIM-type domain-containing protein n=1 Tax=Phytophthora rubi TaxID=129364 RepID=A0A6A4C5X0_9STRA|nr:hypothetical protein PR003_g26894 [Phytophthora rubi]
MDYSPKATTEIVEAAITMVESSRVEFETTSDPNLVRVLENISLTAGATSDDEEEEEDFISTFGGDDSPLTVSDAMATGSSRAIDLFRTLTSGGDPGLSDGEGLHDSEHEQDQLIENQGNATEEQEEEVRNRCKDLYTRATKWSLRRSHRIGMPSDGWVVDLRLKICGCRYLSKFQICAHLIAAQQKYGLASYAPNKIEKLLSRVVGKAQTKRNCTKVPKASVQKRATKSKKSRAKGPPTIVQVRPGAEGRPPRASTALLIQDITDE